MGLLDWFSLPGVTDQSDLTPYQIRVLGCVQNAMHEQAEAESRMNQSHDLPNRGGARGGGGANQQVTRFRNLSAETGKSPEQLIAEHKAKNGI